MERRPQYVPRRYGENARGSITTQTFGRNQRSHIRRCKIPAYQIFASPNLLTLGIPLAILGGSWRQPFAAFRCSAGTRGRSSVGRALEWHSRGQGFDSPRLHGVAIEYAGRLVDVGLGRLPRHSPCGRFAICDRLVILACRLPGGMTDCGNSSVGRAQPCQGWGRGFESRFPLTQQQG
jgi:hypothetical protein